MADTWSTAPATVPTHDTWSTGNTTAAAAADTTTDSPADARIDPRAGTEGYQAAARAHGWTETIPLNYQAYATQSGQDNYNYHAVAPRYEWNREFGVIGPEVPELEAFLFSGSLRARVGDNFLNLVIPVEVEGPERILPIRDFEDAGLHPTVLDNLKKCGFTQPTPIQAYCIPIGMQGTDMIAIAQTGSGKTVAYMVPVLSRLMGKADRLCGPKPDVTAPGYNPKLHKVRAEPLVIIVVPTRELAIQIFDEARRLCYRSMLRPAVVYGGLPMPATLEDLGKGADILIATPGRLVDLMDRPQVLSMSRVKYTIIDEADELLNADWDIELHKIMSGGDVNDDADHVFMLFSATFPRGALDLASEFLTAEHYKVHVGRVGSTHKNIQQDIVWVNGHEKQEYLYKLLFNNKPVRTLIFCNAKKTVDLLDDFLYNRIMPTTSIHSGRGQREREDALRAFRTGECPILIATGVSARGWDVKDIEHVINFDLPSKMYGGISEYVHRIGRTGRIGHQGKATSFYNERNEDIAKSLVNILIETGSEIPEFLASYKNEDGQAHFEDSDEEGGEFHDSAEGFEAPSTDPVADHDTEPFEADGGADVNNDW